MMRLMSDIGIKRERREEPIKEMEKDAQNRENWKIVRHLSEDRLQGLLTSDERKVEGIMFTLKMPKLPD